MKVDQLSAVSQIIQSIQEGLKNNEFYINILGKEVDLNANSAVFVTLNPVGKGYGGRSKLPDNLKQLFRCVAMNAPDIQLITRTILVSEGFKHAHYLSNSVVEVFRFSKQLLSSQQHYDWGLRALKSVLKLVSSLMKAHLTAQTSEISPDESFQSEAIIVIKALRVDIMPKLAFDDIQTFNTLICNIFKDVPVQDIEHTQLKSFVIEALVELELEIVDTQIQKVLQLYEALTQRIGVVLVGPSCSGKSTLIKVLRKALMKLGSTVSMYVMNPKAITRSHLLGYMDLDTREWFDGVLTKAAKEVVKEDITSWICCDGDIDPEWIESLNSVLDDNKILTMPNGVRIQFGPNINFIFETHSLEFASPATVSRMAMIFLSENDVVPSTIVTTWIKKQPVEEQANLSAWFQSYFYTAMDLLLSKNLLVKTTKVSIAISMLAYAKNCSSKKQFTVALINCLTPYLNVVEQEALAIEIYALTVERCPDPKCPLSVHAENGRLCTYQYELGLLEEKQHSIVRTSEIQRLFDIIEVWTRQGCYQPFIVLGPDGSGKAMMLGTYFKLVTGTQVLSINCSPQTSTTYVIAKMKQFCQISCTIQGRILRPKRAEKLVLLIKDINLVRPDPYGTVPLHSLLQQIITYQGFYDDDLEWTRIEKVQVISTMCSSDCMGRYAVSQRFTAINAIISLNYPCDDSYQLIYSNLLTFTLNTDKFKHVDLHSNRAPDIAKVLCSIFKYASSKYTIDTAKHYSFTAKTLTEWIMNLQYYDYTSTTFTEALVYEGQRLFCDRLVSTNDKAHLEEYIADKVSALKGSERPKTSMYFSTCTGTSHSQLSKVQLEDLRESYRNLNELYHRDNTSIDVELIPEVLKWATYIDRVLSRDKGHILLVSTAGCCSTECIKLVAYQHQYQLCQLSMTRDYSDKQFKQDIKRVIMRVATESVPCVLLLEDHYLQHTSFPEVMHPILTTGDATGLFTQEELDALLEGETDGCKCPYERLSARIQCLLRVCACVDPTDPKFDAACRVNPALFANCAVLWVGTWGNESLDSLVGAGLCAQAGAPEALPGLFRRVHALVPNANTAGLRALLRTFAQVSTQGLTAASADLRRLTGGLARLAAAGRGANETRAQVTANRRALQANRAEADAALAEIQSKMSEATLQRAQVRKLQEELDAENNNMLNKKKLIEAELSAIQPALDSAKDAVGKIKPENIAELKALKNPPATVQDVLEAVLILLGKTDTSWGVIKKYLASENIKAQIVNFDTSTITKGTRYTVNKHLKAKGDSFKPEVISRSSLAAAPMAAWVIANIKYSEVLESIAPLTDELKEIEKSLAEFTRKLQDCEKRAEEFDSTVTRLKETFTDKTVLAERLKSQLQQAEETLNSAQDLLDKLCSEKERWDSRVDEIQLSITNMPKLALLASACITYLGAMSDADRAAIMQKWMIELNVTEFNLFNFISRESVKLQYKAEGLPFDRLSMDNALIITTQVKTPLIIDTTDQSLNWIKANLKAKKCIVEVCSAASDSLGQVLELAVRFGKALIVTDVITVEPLFYPIVRKELKTDGTRQMVQLGGKMLDYADTFQLFLFSKMADIAVPPSIKDALTIVNFSVTEAGLEEQLLSITVAHERPELEKEQRHLIQEEERLKMKLSELEDQLLSNLSSSEESLLDNKALIDALVDIKAQSLSIQESLLKSAEIRAELQEKREAYRPLAAAGSRAYFVVLRLVSLSHMYRFSLRAFLACYTETLAGPGGSALCPGSGALIRGMVCNVLHATAPSLFKGARLPFGCLLARAIFAEAATEAEWGHLGSAPCGGARGGCPPWVAAEATRGYAHLAASFPALPAALNSAGAHAWLRWAQSAAPEANFPGAIEPAVPPFQKVLLLQALRPDRLRAGLAQWLHAALGTTATAGISIEAGLPATSATTPALLVTAPGSDPCLELQAVAHKAVGRDAFHQIAMGSGQEEAALNRLRAAASEGHWLLLKNVHLVIHWAQALEDCLASLGDTAHPNFRLWMTSEPHDEFPLALLMRSKIITFEAPPGHKQNLLRNLKYWEDTLNHSSPLQCKVLFAVGWLHSLLQERRNYNPQGWTRPYDFSTVDLKLASSIVREACPTSTVSATSVDWDTLKGLLCNTVYGNNFESELDMRILTAYLNKFLCPSLLREISNYSDCLSAAQDLKEENSPELLCLPPNADILVQKIENEEFIKKLRSLQNNSSDTDKSHLSLLPLIEHWDNLIQSHPDVLTCAQVTEHQTHHLHQYFAKELNRGLTLVKDVNKTIAMINHYCRGKLKLSEGLGHIVAELNQSKVPSCWYSEYGSTPLHPKQWLEDIVSKTDTLRTQFSSFTLDSFYSSPLQLSQLFRPASCLNSLRLYTSQNIQTPLMSLQLVGSISSPDSLHNSNSIHIELQGLRLQGANIAQQHLVPIDSANLAPIITIPSIYSTYTANFAENCVEIPIYTAPDKEDYVASISLPVARADHIPVLTLAGISIFIN